MLSLNNITYILFFLVSFQLHEHTNRITGLNERLLNDQTVMSAQLKTSDDSGISSNGNHDDSQNGLGNSERKHETSLQDELMGMNYSLDPPTEEGNNNNMNNTSTNTGNNDNKDETTEESEESPKIVSEGLTLSADKSKDPDRPRYTLMELQKLLEEKNIYKDKMFEYMEELQLYKNQEV